MQNYFQRTCILFRGSPKEYFLFFLFLISSNLSNVVFQISKSGYKYYTSYSLLKLQFKIHPVVWVGSCVMFIEGLLNPTIARKAAVGIGI